MFAEQLLADYLHLGLGSARRERHQFRVVGMADPGATGISLSLGGDIPPFSPSVSEKASPVYDFCDEGWPAFNRSVAVL